MNNNLENIKEGNIYEVDRIIVGYRTGYVLRGIETNNHHGYAAIRFIECSELDELQLVNELMLVEK